MDNLDNLSNLISSPRFQSTQTPVSLDGKIGKILSLQEVSTKNFEQLNEKLAIFDFISSQNISKISRSVKILENKVVSKNLALNKKLDGVFNYVAERIGVFTEIYKTANLDHQFKLVYDHLDSQLSEANKKWASLQPSAFFHPNWLSIPYRLGKVNDSPYPRKFPIRESSP